MKYIHELSTMAVRARLTRTPTTLRYRIVDLDNNRTALDWVDLTPSSDVTFTVPASANAIFQSAQGKRRRLEKRVIVIQANAGTDDQFNKEEEYAIRNLKGFVS